MAKPFVTKKKSIWSKLTGVDEEELNNAPEETEVEESPSKNHSAREVEIEPEEEDEEEEEVEVKKPAAKSETSKENWMDSGDNFEGQLSVDVYQSPDSIVIKSTIAGVKPEDIDVSIENDMLTIRGQRRQEEKILEENYFYQECYWGGFSRSIILPVEVVTDKIDASLKDGVLTVILPKAKKSKGISIKVKREE